MERKTLIWILAFIGTSVGSAIPSLWGDSMFSFTSVLLSTLGGALGIYAGFKLGQ